MLKATYNGNYRKNGNRVFTYVVSGTPKEIEQYIAAQGERIVFADEAKTIPLWFRTEWAGNIKQSIAPSYALTISFGGKVVVDDAREFMAEEAAIKQASLEHAGRIMAEQRMFRNNQPKTTAAPAGGTPKSEPKSAEDLIDDTTGAGAEQNENVAAGGEGIAD